MRYTLALFLFFLATLPVAGQTTYPLIEGPPPAKLAEASAMMDAVKKSQSPVALSVGGYALIQIKVTTKLTTYVAPGSTDCLDTEMIPKGQIKKVWGVKDGGKEWVRITIPADPDYDRLYVTGTIKGTATILWLTVTNGEAVVFAGYQFDVAGGKPKPEPDAPPVDDPFTKALRTELAKDRVKGLADNKYLDALSGIYEAASRDSLESLKTAGELDSMLNSARVAAGIPEATKMFPSMREWLRGQMVAAIGSTPETQLTPDKRQAAKVLFAKIAAAMEVVAK